MYFSRTTIGVGGLEVPTSNIGFIRTMIMSYASQTDESMKKYLP